MIRFTYLSAFILYICERVVVSAALASEVSRAALSSAFGRLLIFVVMLLSNGIVQPWTVRTRENGKFVKTYTTASHLIYTESGLWV